MLFSDSITLRSVANANDSDGYPTTTNTDTNVWANVKSATRSEFYEGMKAGASIAIAFDVHAEDWGGQTKVLHDSKTYDIIRSYQKGLGTVELNCAEVV